MKTETEKLVSLLHQHQAVLKELGDAYREAEIEAVNQRKAPELRQFTKEALEHHFGRDALGIITGVDPSKFNLEHEAKRLLGVEL